MMRALVLTAVVAVSVAVFGSCSPPIPCATSCVGCCAEDGGCEAGTQDRSCGKAGASCISCPGGPIGGGGQGYRCESQVCTPY